MQEHGKMRSLIDNSKMIYDDQWVVSLVAKAKGKNPEHAIIIVEGILENGLRFCYRRYDFVVKENPNVRVQKCKGKVLVKDDQKTFADYKEEERARYFWAIIIKDIDLREETYGASWIVTPEQAAALHAAVLEDEKSPPDYQISGESGFFGASPSLSGHNCFTWARSKILEIKNQNIQHDTRLKPIFADFIAARTSLHFVPPGAAESVSPNPCRIV